MVPAQYRSVMKKLAAKGDNVDTAVSELKANMKDNKKSLTGLFDNAKEHSVSKLFPGKSEKTTSDPLLKVAFAVAMPKGRFPKTAAQVGVMYLGFKDELAKIANVPSVPGGQAAPLPSMSGFKSMIGAGGATGAGPGLAGGFGKALGGIGKAVSAAR